MTNKEFDNKWDEFDHIASFQAHEAIRKSKDPMYKDGRGYDLCENVVCLDGQCNPYTGECVSDLDFDTLMLRYYQDIRTDSKANKIDLIMARGIPPKQPLTPEIKSRYIPVPDPNREAIHTCPMCANDVRYWPCECGTHILGTNTQGKLICKKGSKLYLKDVPAPKLSDLPMYIKDPNGDIYKYCSECGPEVGKYTSLYPIWYDQVSYRLIHVDGYPRNYKDKTKYTVATDPEVHDYVSKKHGEKVIASNMMNSTAKRKDVLEEDIIYEDWMWVPPIMANPQYYLSMVGKWDRGTSDTGAK